MKMGRGFFGGLGLLLGGDELGSEYLFFETQELP